MSEPRFKTGDKVLVDGNLVAEIHTYDVDSDRLVVVSSSGGSTDTRYGHISNTRLDPFPEAAGTGDEAFTGEAPVAPVAEESDADENDENASE